MGCRELQLNNYFTLQSSKSVVGFTFSEPLLNSNILTSVDYPNITTQSLRSTMKIEKEYLLQEVKINKYASFNNLRLTFLNEALYLNSNEFVFALISGGQTPLSQPRFPVITYQNQGRIYEELQANSIRSQVVAKLHCYHRQN